MALETRRDNSTIRQFIIHNPQSTIHNPIHQRHPATESPRSRHGFHLWQEKQDLCIRLARRPFPRPRRLCPVQPARLGTAARRRTLCLQAGQRAVHKPDADRRRHARTGVQDADVQHAAADDTSPADRGQRAGTKRRRVTAVECELPHRHRPELVSRVPGDAQTDDSRYRPQYTHLRSHDQQQKLRFQPILAVPPVLPVPPCEATGNAGHTVTRVWNETASIRRWPTQPRDVVHTEHVLGKQHVRSQQPHERYGQVPQIRDPKHPRRKRQKHHADPINHVSPSPSSSSFSLTEQERRVRTPARP